jgi:2-methylisocitrate lyase-like PEP mutase family enzyme
VVFTRVGTGKSVIGIEDAVLPTRFGHAGNINELVSIEEMTGKLGAALVSRQDSALVIAARTAAAMKALRDTYSHLFNDGAPTDLKSRIAAPEEMDCLTFVEEYGKARGGYLQ